MTSGSLPDLALARASVDRAAHRRTDEAWLAAAWADPRTRVMRFAHARAAVAGDPPALELRSPAELPDVPVERRYFLGEEGGVAYFGAELDEPEEGFRGLRDVGLLLDDRDAGLLVNVIALANWHATHRYCPRCGEPTVVAAAGYLRRCPADGSEHYPRTDPAVIMTVVDAADRLLLGSQRVWPRGRFSTLAGFVEPGESLEAAVRREVAEEVGVRVGAVRYLGSQPWPFPSSLMVGFVATAESTEVSLNDGEIHEARWFTRAELLEAATSGEVRLSPRVSIARRLIEHWYGDVLPDPPGAW
ncbi:MAG TPA: NAD(+) diphosphatase [Candidatus Eisenbacteria bacterium]|nr:NAD(+) diphosphatase [Candidatus Eisenbacteria bacterium]